MKGSSRGTTTRSRIGIVVMAALMAITTMSLVRCRMVDDTVTGVDIASNSTFSSSRSNCERECNEAYKHCRDQIEKRRRDDRERCERLPSREKKECKKAVSVRYRDAKKACDEQKKDCKKACKYREGSGDGGR